jgi:adenylate cyclase
MTRPPVRVQPPCANLGRVLTAVAVTLGVLLCVAIGVIVWQANELRRQREQVAELQQAVETEGMVPRSPRTQQAVQTAGLAMRTAIDTVSKLRERGVRSTLLGSIDDFTRWALEDRSEIARVAGPDGEVTIFFSDIENSTALNSELGDEQWVKLLAAHDRLLHTYVERHRGLIVKSQGDGYMVVFSTPELALGASLDIQHALSAKRQRSRRLRRTPIRVRIGLHTGTAIEKEGDYFGRNVAMAARVASMADGGEILVSTDIAERLSDSTDFAFVEEDTVEFKGLPGEHQLFSVEAR